jgi:phospholipid/cholesterol/gamma-HCH transport system substrate-binding protein
MEYTRTEIRTGLLIVLAAALAALVIFIVGDFRNLFTSKMRVEAIFDASSGLKPYAGVRYAGVEVGEVRAIRLTRDNPPRVSLDIVVRRDAGIQKGSEATIKTLGFLGERYVEIDPRRGEGPSSRRRPDQDGLGAAGGHGTLFEDLLGNVRQTRKQMDELFGDETFRKDLKEAVKRASDLTEDMKSMLSENRAELKQTLRHARSASGEVDSLLRERRDEISRALEDLASIADKMDRTADDLDALAKKSRGILDRNESNIEGTITDLRSTARNVRDLSGDLKKHPHKIIWSVPNPFRRDKDEEPRRGRRAGDPHPLRQHPRPRRP